MKTREFEPWRVHLREFRIAKNLSNEKIAERADMSVDTVSNVFSGETRYPRVDTMQAILDAMECSWEDVFFDSGAVIGGKSVKELQQRFDIVSLDRDNLVIDLDREKQLNKELTARVIDLENQVKMLELAVRLKDDIITAYKSK